MTEYGEASLNTGPLFNRFGKEVAHAALPKNRVAKCVNGSFRFICGRQVYTLRRDNNAVVLSPSSYGLQMVAHSFQIKRHFGQQYPVRATGYSSVESDPTGVSPHDLHDHNPVVRPC